MEKSSIIDFDSSQTKSTQGVCILALALSNTPALNPIPAYPKGIRDFF